jgi:heme A synthase
VKILRRLAWLATAAAYVQIVLGAVVRISGSGLGCGPNWPLCNGHLIPPLDDIGTLIEYCHRLSALVLGASLLVLVSASWWRRRESPAEARLWRTAALAGALYIGIALLGAVTVLLDLSAWAVIPHLAAALGLLATLVVAILRTKPESSEPTPLRARRSAIAALVLGAAVLLLGGLTANLGAAGACIGFPLCSGSVWPAGRLAVLQWTHRLMAYGLFLHLVGLVAANRRRQAPAGLQRATQAALLLALAQIAVAAVMVLAHLPPLWRGLHAAVGVGVWLSLIVLTGRAMDTPAAA